MNAKTRALSTIALATALSGCGAMRDPAKEAPVDLRPGRYEISYEGAIGGFRIPGQKDGPGSSAQSACITSSVAQNWPKKLVKQGLGMSDSDTNYCSFKNVDRKGNALSGEYVCESDDKTMPGSKIKLAYTGTMTDTSTELEAKMSFVLPDPDDVDPRVRRDVAQLRELTPMLDAVSVVLKAERTGECNG